MKIQTLDESTGDEIKPMVAPEWQYNATNVATIIPAQAGHLKQVASPGGWLAHHQSAFLVVMG
jgi:hypothetical protein